MPLPNKKIKDKPKNISGWLEVLEEKSKLSPHLIFPNEAVKYQDNAIGFATDVLGVELWSKQIEILEAIINHSRIAIKSGHKVSKTFTACIIALWWYCCFPEARVIMTAVTAQQIRNVLWRQLSLIHFKSKTQIDGTLSEIPSGGLKSFDFREIIGFTAKDKEAMAGYSGKILYILDEASGIPDSIFEAIEGNRAGGARIIMFSNPTRLSGKFYDAFHKDKKFWHTISISSEESPNVIQGKEVIPHLAGIDWINEKKEEWGENSPLYQIRIKGNFPNQDECIVVPTDLVVEATERFESLNEENCEIDLNSPEYQGLFVIGVDPARFGGDESSICFRRNLRVYPLVTANGLDSNQLLQLFYSEFHKVSKGVPMAPGRLPTVYVDNTGGFGSGFIDNIDRKRFNVKEIHFASKAFSNDFTNVRAEMWFNITAWLKSGPCILADDQKSKLSHELTAVQYHLNNKGQRQIQDKQEIKKLIKRSPDRADSLALTFYDFIPHKRVANKPLPPIKSKPIQKPTMYNILTGSRSGVISKNNFQRQPAYR